MISEPTIGAIRFGYGLGPRLAGQDAAEIGRQLSAPDRIAAAYPVPSTAEALDTVIRFRKARRAAKRDDAGRDDAGRDSPLAQARRALRQVAGRALVQAMARILETDAPARERLLWFWADHFTAVPKSPVMGALAGAYLDEAIRPHLAGRFADMLKAVVTHPFMLDYLDQTGSVGPNSRIGRRRGRGLNENLAREVLELHTLGVDGPYTQQDVRQLAELMTGLGVSRKRHGFVFNPEMAEPGAETVLGRRYGGGRPRLDDVLAALEDLATHPATARHLARKIAVHFVSDSPDPALVAALERAWLDSDGDLSVVHAALLAHPSAWAAPLAKAKQPFDFVASALVAAGLRGPELEQLRQREQEQLLARPLAAMGQPFMRAPGPDGWPEEAEAWITPQGLAARIAYARWLAGRAAGRIGDGVRFLEQALADAAGAQLRWAVDRASGPSEAMVLVLASAEFNRR